MLVFYVLKRGQQQLGQREAAERFAPTKAPLKESEEPRVCSGNSHGVLQDVFEDLTMNGYEWCECEWWFLVMPGAPYWFCCQRLFPPLLPSNMRDSIARSLLRGSTDAQQIRKSSQKRYIVRQVTSMGGRETIGLGIEKP